jgi:hypothetical protein
MTMFRCCQCRRQCLLGYFRILEAQLPAMTETETGTEVAVGVDHRKVRLLICKDCVEDLDLDKP